MSNRGKGAEETTSVENSGTARKKKKCRLPTLKKITRFSPRLQVRITNSGLN